MAFPTYGTKTKGGKGHGDPFLMLSNNTFPTDYVSSLDFAAYLYYMNGVFQEVSKRVVAHFITDIDFEEDGGDTDEQRSHKSLLIDQLDIFQAMQLLGIDQTAYGVGVHRIHYPFHRYLVDKRSGKSHYYNVSDFPRDMLKFDASKGVYMVPDPVKAKEKGTWEGCPHIPMEIKDIFVRDRDKLRLVPLDPRYCRFDFGQMSRRMQVVYQFDPEHRASIKAGNIFDVGETHHAMLQAICNNKDFRYDDDSVFVFTDSALTGISKKGIGIPKAISHYRELYQLQLYRKIDETIARDFMTPIRMFSPGYGSQGGATTLDPMFMQAGREWKANMAEVVRRHRETGDSIFAIPYPTQYTEASGNGKVLTPQPMMEWQTTSLLNSLGYPAELFNCTLAYDQVPTSLRLFERAQHFIPHNLEKYLRWVNKKVCSFLKIQEYQVALAKPRIADDVEKNQILMQLVQAGELPREYLLKELGLEGALEIYKKRLREDSDQERARVEQQKELEQKVNGPGDTSGAGGDGGGTGTPLDNQKKAMEKAEQWSQMDERSRKADMEALGSTDPSLQALAQKFLGQIRTDAEAQGRDSAVNPQ